MSARQIDTPTLHDMLVIENDPAVLGFRCAVTDLPLWPQIRVALLRMMMSDLLYGVQLTGRSNTTPSRPRAIGTLTRSVLRNTVQRWRGQERARICITCDGVADQMVQGRWFNRLTDYFIDSRPDESLAIADHFEWRWPFPRRHERVLLHAPWQAMNAMRGRLSVHASHERRAQELVELICERAFSHLRWSLDSARKAQLATMLARKTASMPWQFDAYAALLRRIRPAVLMVGGGCYGPAGSLIAAAKTLGINTAEYQHGSVSAGHDAYNFAPVIRESENYRRTLPDHFLGYGAWWNEQINAPVRKWAIGNPHRTARMQALAPVATSPNDLLVLSDGIEFDLYLNLARELRAAATRMDLRVILRPHPLERTRALALTSAETGGVCIDQNADLYASLRTAHAVVSEVSTGLFEAVGITERIFVWDTPKARFGHPKHPFQVFHSTSHLLELLSQDKGGRLPRIVATEAIWADDWSNRYSQFLAEQGAL